MVKALLWMYRLRIMAMAPTPVLTLHVNLWNTRPWSPGEESTSLTARSGWVHKVRVVYIKAIFTKKTLLSCCVFDHRWISEQAVIQTRWRCRDLGWPRLASRPSSQHTSPLTAQRLVKVKLHKTVASFQTAPVFLPLHNSLIYEFINYAMLWQEICSLFISAVIFFFYGGEVKWVTYSLKKTQFFSALQSILHSFGSLFW